MPSVLKKAVEKCKRLSETLVSSALRPLSRSSSRPGTYHSDRSSNVSELSGSFWKAARRGAILRQDFFEEVPQSQFLEFSQLMQHGWEIDFEDPLFGVPRSHEIDKLAMYRDNNIPTSRSDNLRTKIVHSRVSYPDGRHKKYRPTQAFYECTLNPRAIVAISGESPAYRARRDQIPRDDIVRLQHWSDVVFLLWQNYCQRRGLPMSGLTHIIQQDVDNPRTRRIIPEVLSSADFDDLRPWRNDAKDPGAITFPLGCEAFDAILGSPNGVGPAFFLAQHKEALGEKVIAAVSVVCHPDSEGSLGLASFCFHVQPLE